MLFWSKRFEPGLIVSHEGSELLFYQERNFPEVSLIRSFFDLIGPSKVKWKLPRNYVIREEKHFLAWINAFIQVESDELKERFRLPEKSYEVRLFGNRVLSAAALEVRLKTSGISGSTRYAISMIKIDEDEFICIE